MQQLLYLLVLVNVVGSLIEKSFFNLWVRFQNEVFSFFCVTERLLINSRSDLTTKWSILQFLKLEFASFCLLHICVKLNLQELLECDCLSMILNLLDSYLEGYFGLFFKCAITFQPWVFLKSIGELQTFEATVLLVGGCVLS